MECCGCIGQIAFLRPESYQSGDRLSVEHDSSFNHLLFSHSVQTFLPLFNSIGPIHNSIESDLPRLHVFQYHGHMLHTAEARQHCDLVLPYTKWRPGNLDTIVVDAIHNQLATFPYKVDRLFENSRGACGFYDDIESVWVVNLQSVEFRM
jgi:hypothetical protein